LPAAPSIGLLNRNDAITSNRGEREWESELELPVWLPGQRAAREALARDAASGLSDTKATLNLQVAGMVRNALWDIAMTTHQATLANSRHQTALGLLSDVEKRVKAGDLAKTDIMLAQNEAYQAETFLLRAEAEVKHAQYRYKLLTGLNTIPEAFTEQQVKTSLDDNHPALRDASKKILVADDERNLIKVERRENPTVSISARTQRGVFDNQTNETLGLKLRIPFETEAQSAPLMANAEMNYAKNQAEAKHLRYALEGAFHEAEHNLQVTKAELAITTKQHANAQESLRLAKKAFALGETDLVNLLRVQASAYEAERAMKQRQIQLQWDTAHYNQAVGEMP
jgi:outer membrane protein TolC